MCYKERIFLARFLNRSGRQTNQNWGQSNVVITASWEVENEMGAFWFMHFILQKVVPAKEKIIKYWTLKIKKNKYKNKNLHYFNKTDTKI